MATINGTAGNDILNGTFNADTINGGAGDDIIDGKGAISGREALNGDAGNDTIYTGDIGTVTVHGGIGNDTIIGAGGVQTLYGDDGDDIIQGGGGADVIYGGAGNDKSIPESSPSTPARRSLTAETAMISFILEPAFPTSGAKQGMIFSTQTRGFGTALKITMAVPITTRLLPIVPIRTLESAQLQALNV